jgi:hypothetical protein
VVILGGPEDVRRLHLSYLTLLIYRFLSTLHQASMPALLRFYQPSIKDLSRLYQGCMQALYSSIQALLRLY